MKKILVSFGDKTLKYSAFLLLCEAKKMEVYDEIYIMNEDDLDVDFRSSHKDFMKKNKGFGFWIWKPQVIKQIFDKIEENDIVHYLDIGCQLFPQAKERLNDYFEIANKSKGILGFQYGQENKPSEFSEVNELNFLEKQFTKKEALNYFGMVDNESILNSGQILAGIIFFKKNKFSIEFLNEWSAVFDKRIDLVNDLVDKNNQLKNFVENRHDQSIFSLLGKIKKVKTLSAYEVEPLKFKLQLETNSLLSYPIKAIRRKDKKLLDVFIKQFKFKIKLIINKIFFMKNNFSK